MWPFCSASPSLNCKWATADSMLAVTWAHEVHTDTPAKHSGIHVHKQMQNSRFFASSHKQNQIIIECFIVSSRPKQNHMHILPETLSCLPFLVHMYMNMYMCAHAHTGIWTQALVSALLVVSYVDLTLMWNYADHCKLLLHKLLECRWMPPCGFWLNKFM